MPKLGIDSALINAEISHINSLASTVLQDADNLKAVAKKISSKGIQGVSWYDGTFTAMLNKLESNNVDAAVNTITKEAKDLQGVQDVAVGFAQQQ